MKSDISHIVSISDAVVVLVIGSPIPHAGFRSSPSIISPSADSTCHMTSTAEISASKFRNSDSSYVAVSAVVELSELDTPTSQASASVAVSRASSVALRDCVSTTVTPSVDRT